MIKKATGILVSLVLFSPATAAVVSGDYLGTFAGNDSAKSLTMFLGFEVAELAKVDYPEDGTSNDGLEISDLVMDNNDEPTSGGWSYSGMGVVDFIVIKAGDMYAVYAYTDENTSNMRNVGIWDTSGVDNKGLSHITAYTRVIPIPGALWLMMSGVLGLGLVRRRK